MTLNEEDVECTSSQQRRRPETAAIVALLFNKLSDNLCGHSQRRYLLKNYKMIAPILDEIAEEYQGKLTIVKLNIDQNPGTAPKYGIRGIPTLLLFKNGEVAATKVGALSKGQLKEFLDANLA